MDTLWGMREAPATFDQPAATEAVQLEKRGRSWLLWSFLLCPCHLPWTLAILATVAGGSSLGVVLRDHAWLAGTLVTAAWVLGTAYGFRLIRRAERSGGACPTRTPKTPKTRTS